MKPRTYRARLAAILALVMLPLSVLLTSTAGPARAAPAPSLSAPASTDASTVYTLGDPDGYYLNWWNGSTTLNAYFAVTYNDFTYLQSIGGGQYQLVDGISGGCVGDAGGSQYSARAGGGDYCPTTGTAGWGTIFTLVSCSNGYCKYRNNHWAASIGFSNSNGAAVYLNTGGTPLVQEPGGNPAAAALTAAITRTVSAAGIFGPCNALEDGELRYFGVNLYECKYVDGFGGYYWVGPIDESCGAVPASAPAAKPDVRIC